jgi:hypothetical protein
MITDSQSAAPSAGKASAGGSTNGVTMTARTKAWQLAPIWFCAATILSFPVHAQPPGDSDIESVIEPSLQAATGIALARQQIAQTDLMGAVGTLERVLIVDPEAHAARLLYASLLCRLDDAAGARVELSFLQGQALDDMGWADVTAACGTMTRPSADAGAASTGEAAR